MKAQSQMQDKEVEEESYVVYDDLISSRFTVWCARLRCIFYDRKRRANSSFLNKGENGHIQVKDGVYLNHQTSAFLFEVDGKQVFTVISNNGVQSQCN